MPDALDQLVGDLEAPYTLLFSTTRSIGTLIPDVVVSEVHNDTSVVTQHPVEGGSSIADHIFDNPPVLQMRGGYSDTTGGYPGYVNDAYQAILALKAQRRPFQVMTGSRLYDSMAITNVNVTKDVDTEFALMFAIDLQQVTITSSSDTQGQDSQADPASTSSTSDAGNKNLQTTSGVTGTESETAASARTGVSVQPAASGAESETAASSSFGGGYTVSGVGQAVPLPPTRPAGL